jgi:hypothetical protein
MGVATAAWTEPLTDMVKATDWLNEQKFPVVLSVTTNKKDSRYKNVNIAEVLSREAVKNITRPVVTITEEDINSDSVELLEESITGDFNKQFKEAEAYIENMNRSEVIQQITASGLEISDIANVHLNLLKQILLRHFVSESGRNPDEFLPAPVPPPFDVGGVLVEALEEKDETVEEEEEGTVEEEDEDSVPLSVMEQAQIKTHSMNREDLKRARLMYGECKFVKSMTDDVIRQMVVMAATEADKILF